MRSLLPRYRVLLLHLSFWGVYFSFYFYQYQQEYGWRRALALALLPMLCNALLAYFAYFYLLPRWLARPRRGRYLLAMGLAFGLMVAVKTGVQQHIMPASAPPAYLHSVGFVLGNAFSMLFVTVFVGMLRFAVERFELEARTRALENAQLAAELQFLKAQINPHFLFNTLNNLYYLAYSQSPNTPEVIAKLAQMMRYLIHDSNQPVVPLSQEIEHLRNYISLEELRLNTPVPITFEVAGEPAGVGIAPLILLAFLENAFKHGVRHHDPAAWVAVRLQVAPTACVFSVANHRPAAPAPAGAPGTGLLNVRRRLALSYPGRHTLRIDDTRPDEYHIHLTLSFV